MNSAFSYENRIGTANATNPMNKFRGSPLLAAIMAMTTLQTTTLAQYQPGERVYSPPRFGTFWTLQTGWTNTAWAAPLPFFPFDPVNVPLYAVTNDSFFFEFDWAGYSDLFGSPMDDSGTGGEYGPLFNTNDLWLEIQKDTNQPGYVDLILHGTTNGFWELFSEQALSVPLRFPPWTPRQIIQVTDNTNEIFFTPVLKNTPEKFFRAVGGVTVASVTADNRYTPYAIEPCSTNDPGVALAYQISINPTVDFPLTIFYTMSGSASNNVDYTSLTGSVTLAANTSSTNIWLQPKYDPTPDFDEFATLTLVVTNGVLVDPVSYKATITILECTHLIATNFTVVATNIPYPASIDYHDPAKALVIGVNWKDGLPYDFALLHTNSTVTQWSGVASVPGEIKFGTVKTTASGWTNGDLYFQNFSPGVVAWLSADGTRSNLNWLTLTNETDLLQPAYVDQTGIWGGNLLAVGDGSGGLPTRNIWRINSLTNAALITNILSDHLEGILTLPNDARYVPWSGKLLTGDEVSGLTYAIDTNGIATPFDLDIKPDDFRVIPANQSLYLLNYVDSDPTNSRVLKISTNLFTKYIGDILIEQAGESVSPPDSRLLIAHWDSSLNSFVTRSITLSVYYDGHLEHVVFAPIEIPNL
jgi:hypothetical protein